jgi:hypothetical protein
MKCLGLISKLVEIEKDESFSLSSPLKRYLASIRDTNSFKFLTEKTLLDRESNLRPLAYGNTASIEGTTTQPPSQIPFYKNRRFNDQGRT